MVFFKQETQCLVRILMVVFRVYLDNVVGSFFKEIFVSIYLAVCLYASEHTCPIDCIRRSEKNSQNRF